MTLRHFCTFHLGQWYLGIPIEHVQEVMRPRPLTPVPLASSFIRGLINLRGQIVTAINLRARLGLDSLSPQTPSMNIVLRENYGAISLMVDEIADMVQVHEDAFEQTPRTLNPVARQLLRGAYKLPNQLLMELDVAEVLNFESSGNSA